MTAPSDRAAHWQNVYQTKSDRETSWHQDEPSTSLDLIRRYTARGSRILDVGGGTSTLAGRLVLDGFEVCVFDISQAALDRAKERNHAAADQIGWIVGDITKIQSPGEFDLWHDRAVFHFLTEENDRRHYITRAQQSVKKGGHLVVGTFALDGPDKCSGLPVQRYDNTMLTASFSSSGFEPVQSLQEMHVTPWGKSQPFCFAVMRKV